MTPMVGPPDDVRRLSYARGMTATHLAATGPVPRDGRAPEQAWPVRELAVRLRDYIARLNRVWIEGQVVEVSRRSGAGHTSRCATSTWTRRRLWWSPQLSIVR